LPDNVFLRKMELAAGTDIPMMDSSNAVV
jgi:hypothetical protein